MIELNANYRKGSDIPHAGLSQTPLMNRQSILITSGVAAVGLYSIYTKYFDQGSTNPIHDRADDLTHGRDQISYSL